MTLLAVGFSVVTARAADLPTYPDHAHPLVYRDAENREHPVKTPADWLKRVERTGFEKGLFSTWRDDRNFVLNDERYAGASILVAGPSFGVGSSREHAVWAIQQYGFDAIHLH